MRAKVQTNKNKLFAARFVIFCWLLLCGMTCAKGEAAAGKVVSRIVRLMLLLIMSEPPQSAFEVSD